MTAKSDYPFRLLCRVCNSYRFTTLERQGHLIKMECQRCKNKREIVRELFGNQSREEQRSDP